MDSIFEVLIEYGFAGLFIAWMLYTSLKNDKKTQGQQLRFEKRIDTIRKENQARQDTLRSDNEERQQAIRNSYKAVIEKYDDQISSFSAGRSEFRSAQAEILESIKKEVSENGKAIARLDSAVSMILSQRGV